MWRTSCSLEHSRKVYDATHPRGCWIRGDDEAFGIVFASNGQPHIKARCRHCNQTSSALPAAAIRAWGLTVTDLTWQQVNNPIEHEPCCVLGCGATPTEYHHFAPRNTFGVEADNWPCLPLCLPHHVEWHQKMDGYQRNRRGAA